MIDNSKEYIVCAAIHYTYHNVKAHNVKNLDYGVVLCGFRHAHIIMQYYAITNKDTNERNSTQGFLTSTNRFVDRREAFNIALKAGQIEGGKLNGQLYSEDLY